MPKVYNFIKKINSLRALLRKLPNFQGIEVISDGFVENKNIPLTKNKENVQ